MPLVQLNSLGKHIAPLVVIGSVEDVIAGRVRPDLKTRIIHAKEYRFGFELGSPHGIESMGESVVVNGNCYTTSTDKNDHYLKTIFGESFYTSGMFLVPRNTTANFTLKPESTLSAVGYDDFCNEVYQGAGAACLFAAVLRFKHLEATHIKKAPISGDNIFAHQDIYYGDLKLRFADTYCFIVGAVADFQQDSKEVIEALKVVLYQNPLDTKNELTVHTHGVNLNRPVANPNEIHPHDVTHTVHIYNANTFVDEVLWGEVYLINTIDSL